MSIDIVEIGLELSPGRLRLMIAAADVQAIAAALPNRSKRA
jgi:hypothetical protein